MEAPNPLPKPGDEAIFGGHAKWIVVECDETKITLEDPNGDQRHTNLWRHTNPYVEFISKSKGSSQGLCPMCGCDDYGWVMAALKCEKCWYTE